MTMTHLPSNKNPASLGWPSYRIESYQCAFLAKKTTKFSTWIMFFSYGLTRICLFWSYVGGYPKCQDCQQSVASLEDAGCGNFQYHFLALPSESTTDLLARYDAWPLLSYFCLARAVLPFAALYPRLGTMPKHANYAGQQIMFPLQSQWTYCVCRNIFECQIPIVSAFGKLSSQYLVCYLFFFPWGLLHVNTPLCFPAIWVWFKKWNPKIHWFIIFCPKWYKLAMLVLFVCLCLLHLGASLPLCMYYTHMIYTYIYIYIHIYTHLYIYIYI